MIFKPPFFSLQYTTMINCRWTFLVILFAISGVLHRPACGQPPDPPKQPPPRVVVPRHVPPLLGKLVYAAQREGKNSLFALDLATEEENNIGPCPSPNQRFSLSGDGRTIVYSLGSGKFHPETKVPAVHIWRSGIDGSNPQQLTQEETWHDYPSLSADGRRVTWVSMVEKRFQVFVMNTEGNGRVQISKQPTGTASPVISPDGTFVVYYSGKKLFRVQSDGTNEKQLTTGPGSSFGQAISPDGKTITYLYKADTRQDIYRMNSDGTAKVQLTALQAEFGPIVFSPNGKQIAFRSNFDGAWKLYRMNTDGTGLRLAMMDAETNSNVSWPGNGNTNIPPLPTQGAIHNGMTRLASTPAHGNAPSPDVKVSILPLPESSQVSPASVAGTAESAAGIARVTLCLMRYPDSESKPVAAYWNCKQKTWQQLYSAEAHEALATGTMQWKLALPPLPPGFYGARSTAWDTAGKSQQSDVRRFQVVTSSTIATPHSDAPAPEVNLLDIKNSFASRTITLRFSGPLDANAASRMSSYTVTIDGRPVKLHGISYDARQHTVELKLGVAISDVNAVKVQWNLKDGEGRELQGSK